MTDFATLVLGADARGLKEGVTALDGLAATAERTEDRVVKVTVSMSNAADLLAAAVRTAAASETVARLASADAAQRAADRVLASAAEKMRAEQAAADAVAAAARREQAAREALAASYSQLRASLDPVYASSMQYSRAVDTVDAAVKAGIVSQEQANRVLAQAEKAYLAITPPAKKVEQATRSASVAMAETGRASGNMAFGIQNAAFQISDFFVMIEGGISPMRAVATQLPQLLGPLGLMGAVIGGVVSAGAALAPMLFDTGNAAQEAGAGLESANEQLEAFRGNAQIATKSALELANAYGKWGQEIRANAVMMAQQNIANAQNDLANGNLVGGVEGVAAAFAKLSAAVDALPMAGAFGAGMTEDLLQAKENVALMRAEVEAAAKAMGLTVTEALRINAALDAVEAARGPQAMADAAGNALAVLSQIAPEIIAANVELREARQSLTELERNAAQAAVMGDKMAGAFQDAGTYLAKLFGMQPSENWLSSAIAKVTALAGQTWSAAKAAIALGSTASAVSAPALTGPAGMAAGETPEGRRAAKLAEDQAAANRLIATLGQVTTTARGASGGVKKIADELTASEKAATAFADTMQDQVKGAVEGTVDWFLDGFQGGIKGLLQSWGNALKQMIGMAIKSRLTSYLFGGGTAVAGTAAAAGTVASGGAGTGLLSGALGAWGASGAVGTGFLGGLQGSLSGGLGGFFSVGANAAAAGGGLAATLGAVAAPLAAVALLFSAFKTKTTLLDAGLKVSVDGIDTLVQRFETINKKRLFGLISSTKTSVSDVDAKTAAAVTAAVTGVQDGVRNAAAALGVAGTTFDDFAYQMEVSTKGMTSEQASQAVQEALVGMGDAMAEMVDGLAALTGPTEGASEALTRLANAATAVNAMTDTLGLAFKAAGLAGADLASDLVDRFGGLDALSSSVSTYYQAFYGSQERLAILTRQTTAAMDKLGLAMPSSAAAFRAMVEAQDLTTEAGRTTFAALIGLSGAMGEIVGTVDGLASAFDETRATIRAYIEDLTGAASELVSPAMALANAQSAYSRALAATADGSGSASDLTSAATAMLSATRDTAGSALDVARAQAQVIAQLNAVAGGGLVDSGGSIPVVTTSPVAAATQANAEAITALKAEVATLSDLMAQIGNQTITFAKRTAEALQKWDADGLPATRT